MSLTGSLSVRATLNNSLTGVDLSTPSEAVNQTISKSIASGVLYHDTYALGISETLALNFGNDSLSDVFGNTINMAVVTGVYIKAASTNTVDLNVSTGVTPIFGDLPPLSAGEGFGYLADIDTSTNSILYIDNGAAVGSVDIIVCGTE